MPRYTFTFETDPPPYLTVTVPADTIEEARTKAEAAALRIGEVQTLGRLLEMWEEPPSTEIPGTR